MKSSGWWCGLMDGGMKKWMVVWSSRWCGVVDGGME